MINCNIDRYETFMEQRKVVYIGRASKVRGLWYQTKIVAPRRCPAVFSRYYQRILQRRYRRAYPDEPYMLFKP